MTAATQGDWVKQGAGRSHLLATITPKGAQMACGATRRPTVKLGATPTTGYCTGCMTLAKLKATYKPERATDLMVPPAKVDPRDVRCLCGCDPSDEARMQRAAIKAAAEATLAERRAAFDAYLAKRDAGRQATR